MRNTSQSAASGHKVAKWHQVPKLPEELLEYSHPKMREYIHDLVSTSETILQENWALQKEVGRLTEQLEIYAKRLLFPGKAGEKTPVKDSQTSDQPPSWDHFKKPRTRSQRELTVRKPGGQVGHVGQTLNPVSNPGIIRRHSLKECPDCLHSLSEIPTAGTEKRQVFDLILPQLEVTEHQVERKVCPICQCQKQSEFPADVKADTQYGNRIKSWAIYFMNYQLIPFERTSEICEDLFNHPISLGTLMNFSTQGFRSLKATELKIKAALIHSEVLQVDESGIACEGENQWLHVASSPTLTHFAIHPRRGLKAMDEIGIIPEFRGTLVHDHFNPYFNYKFVKHALCNAHILRELNFIQENDNKEEWAGAMKSLLIKARDLTEEWSKRTLALPEEEINRLEVEFDEIIAQGLTYHRKKK